MILKSLQKNVDEQFLLNCDNIVKSRCNWFQIDFEAVEEYNLKLMKNLFLDRDWKEKKNFSSKKIMMFINLFF